MDAQNARLVLLDTPSRLPDASRAGDIGRGTTLPKRGMNDVASTAAVASFFVHSDSIESFDQSATTLLADSSSRSIA